MNVIPSILVQFPDRLTEELNRLLPFYKRFQVDYADGHFVPGVTAHLEDLFERLVAYPQCIFDIHLMTSDYEKALDVINTYLDRIKFNAVFIHHRSSPPPELFIDSERPYNVGLVLDPQDEIETIKHIYDLPNIKNIQLMTVVAGAQGRDFIPEVLNKIDQLRDVDYKNSIILDGSINLDTLSLVQSHPKQPDFVCPGSYFSHADDVEKRVQDLALRLMSGKQ